MSSKNNNSKNNTKNNTKNRSQRSRRRKIQRKRRSILPISNAEASFLSSVNKNYDNYSLTNNEMNWINIQIKKLEFNKIWRSQEDQGCCEPK